jgi:chromosome partitioning protein
MKIITIAHQKGGVGKSTLALNIASCFKQGDVNTAIIDMDLQGSIQGLKDVYTEIPILFPPTQLEDIRSLPYDILIIDTPPYLTNTLVGLFQISDFILVPTKTGFFDVMAIKSTIALIKQAIEKKPQIVAGIVLNMVKSRSAITEEVKHVLSDYGVGILNTMIFDRVSYIRSTLTGGVITSDDKKAKEEMTDLVNEIVECFD